jgi:hypothetical protein
MNTFYSSYWRNQGIDGRSPEWSATQTYEIGDLVWHNGNFYEALTVNNNSNPVSNPTDWELINTSDIQWDINLTYSVGQIVWYTDSFYLCILESTGDQPDTSPTYWDKQVSAPGTTWSAEATYGTGDLVWYDDFFWESQIDDNLNNTPVEGASWSVAKIEQFSVNERTAGESLTAPVFVYSGTDGKLYIGDNREVTKSFLTGVCLNSVSADGTTYTRLQGKLGGFTGLIAGTSYYLGNSGQPITKGSILDGEQIVFLGTAISTTDLDLNIQPPQPANLYVDAPLGTKVTNAISGNSWLLSHGFAQAAYDNAISQSVFSAYFAEIGHMYNDAHVAVGDADLSGSSTLFYPTPPPDSYGRVGFPNFTTDQSVFTNGSVSIDLGVSIERNFYRNGTTIRIFIESGTLDSALTEGQVYYGRSGNTKDDGLITLHVTEEDAINYDNPIEMNGDGSGTYKWTQEGIRIDDAFQAHAHDIPTGGGAESGSFNYVRTGTFYSSQGDDVNATNPITFGSNGTPRTSNETRGKTHIEFDYYKIEAVTPSGETVSAQRYDTGWISVGSSFSSGATIIISHETGETFDKLIKDFVLRDPLDNNREYPGELFFDVGGAKYGQKLTGVLDGTTPSTSEVAIQIGVNGARYYSDTGSSSSIPTTFEYKVTLTKPNLIATVSDVPDVVEITDAVDVVKTLPNPSEMAGERIYRRKGSGTGKFTLNCPSGVFLDFGDALLSSIDLEGNGTLIVTPSGGNLLVKEYRDSGSNANGEWEKFADGTLKQRGTNTQTVAVGANAEAYVNISTSIDFYDTNYLYFCNARPTASSSFYGFIYHDPAGKTVNNFRAVFRNGVNIQTITDFQWSAEGRWRA